MNKFALFRKLKKNTIKLEPNNDKFWAEILIKPPEPLELIYRDRININKIKEIYKNGVNIPDVRDTMMAGSVALYKDNDILIPRIGCYLFELNTFLNIDKSQLDIIGGAIYKKHYPLDVDYLLYFHNNAIQKLQLKIKEV